jgi:hypothetical protein
LKFIENLVLVLGIDESREGPAVKQVDVVVLIRLMRGCHTSLALEQSVMLVPEYREIWNTLKMIGVTFEYHATGEDVAELLNEASLEWCLYTAHHTS